MKVCAGHTWRHEEIVVEDKESCPLFWDNFLCPDKTIKGNPEIPKGNK